MRTASSPVPGVGSAVRSIGLCGSLFVLEPGLAQLAATGLVLAATVGLTFSVQARFASSLVVDVDVDVDETLEMRLNQHSN